MPKRAFQSFLRSPSISDRNKLACEILVLIAYVNISDSGGPMQRDLISTAYLNTQSRKISVGPTFRPLVLLENYKCML